MTTPFRQQAKCPKCETYVPLETPFSRWIRNRKDYDSSNGFVLMDKDLIVHRYMVHNNREIPYIMCVEVKTNGANLSPTQHDTLWTFSQLITNTTYGPEEPKNKEPHKMKVYSTMNNAYYEIKSFGCHVLLLSKDDPENSDQIKWDDKIVDKEVLMKILRFEINPYSLIPIFETCPIRNLDPLSCSKCNGCPPTF
jgi:hypothetical protein